MRSTGSSAYRSPKTAAFVFGFALFMGLMLGVIVPASMKLAAPLACPNGYVRTAVVVETSTTSEGNTTSGTLYCIDAAGVLVHANPLVAFLGLGLEVGVALLAVAALLRVSAFVRGDTQ